MPAPPVPVTVKLPVDWPKQPTFCWVLETESGDSINKLSITAPQEGLLEFGSVKTMETEEIPGGVVNVKAMVCMPAPLVALMSKILREVAPDKTSALNEVCAEA